MTAQPFLSKNRSQSESDLKSQSNHIRRVLGVWVTGWEILNWEHRGGTPYVSYRLETTNEARESGPKVVFHHMAARVTWAVMLTLVTTTHRGRFPGDTPSS